MLEVGCGIGDLLAAVRPARGLGIDFSPAIIDLASKRHTQLEFQVADALDCSPAEPFDYLLLSDLVNDLPDVQAVLTRLREVSPPQTRLVVNFFNNLWRPILALAEKVGAKAPTLPQNWLSAGDMKNLLHLAEWEVIKQETRILWPLATPLIAPFFNRWLAPLMRPFCLTVFLVARPRPQPRPERQYRCTVVIPARNEAGNIPAAIASRAQPDQ